MRCQVCKRTVTGYVIRLADPAPPKEVETPNFVGTEKAFRGTMPKDSGPAAIFIGKLPAETTCFLCDKSEDVISHECCMVGSCVKCAPLLTVFTYRQELTAADNIMCKVCRKRIANQAVFDRLLTILPSQPEKGD